MKRCSIPLVTMMFSACALAATDISPIVEIVDFEEEYSSSVDVSGRLLVGYQMEGDAPYSTGKVLYFATPDSISDVDVLISSIDGVYSAALTLRVINSVGQWSMVSIPSEHYEELEKYSPEELVALAYVELPYKGKKKRKKIFPTSWGKPGERQIFYINTTSSFPTWVAKGMDGKVIKGRCNDLDAEVHTAFNYACVIEGKIAPGQASPVTFKAGRSQTSLVWTVK